MSQIEDRLRRAATETRQLAETQRPATLPTSQRAVGNQGLLVLASAFAVVLFLFGALPLLLDSDTDSAPPETAPLASPSSTTASSTSLPATSCSAAGFDGPATRPELPEPVAATLGAVIDAALSCDFDALEARAGEDFVASFGGGGAESLREWETEGRGELDTLLELLHMSHEVIQRDDGGATYVWPSAYVHESWDEVPAWAVEELRAIHISEEIESFETADGYLGWRTAIDSDGNWLYFVAGD